MARNHWEARPESSHDTAVKRGDRDKFEGVVKNTHKVLVTPGMLGTMVFSTDPETQGLLRSHMVLPDSV